MGGCQEEYSGVEIRSGKSARDIRGGGDSTLTHYIRVSRVAPRRAPPTVVWIRFNVVRREVVDSDGGACSRAFHE